MTCGLTEMGGAVQRIYRLPPIATIRRWPYYAGGELRGCASRAWTYTCPGGWNVKLYAGPRRSLVAGSHFAIFKEPIPQWIASAVLLHGEANEICAGCSGGVLGRPILCGRIYLGLSGLILAGCAGGAAGSRTDPYPIGWASAGVFDRWPCSAGSSTKAQRGDAALVFPGGVRLFGAVMLGLSWAGPCRGISIYRANIEALRPDEQAQAAPGRLMLGGRRRSVTEADGEAALDLLPIASGLAWASDLLEISQCYRRHNGERACGWPPYRDVVGSGRFCLARTKGVSLAIAIPSAMRTPCSRVS